MTFDRRIRPAALLVLLLLSFAVALPGAGAESIHLIVLHSNDSHGNLFASDGTVLARIGGYGPGQGHFANPCDVAVDAAGNVYVADTGNNRIQKFRPVEVA